MGYSKKKTPKERLGAGALPPTCFLWDSPFFWRVKGGQSAAAGMGAVGLGGLNKRQAQSFCQKLPAW